MNSAVLCEVRAEAKGFAAHVTGVRLLPSVDSSVMGQVGLLRKGFPTFGTDKGLLPGVHPLVHRKT